jgi:hypothetical protein
MIGDRYDNDCEPLLDMNLSDDDKVGVGTCRLLSGKRGREHCPPRGQGLEGSARHPTLYVCDTLAQIAHILQNQAAWEGIALLKDVTPPVLLEPRNKVVFYGPTTASADQEDKKGEDKEKEEEKKLEELAPKFKHLCWARTDETLRNERAVREILDHIERDLAVCEPASLSQLFRSVRDNMVVWWQEANERKAAGLSEEPAASLLRGALRILSGVNWWRYLLRRPLLEKSAGNLTETLEWTLGSFILACLNVASLDTSLGPLRWAEHASYPELFKPENILDAVPFSHEGIAIVSALERAEPQFADRRVTRWLDMARSIPSN